MTADLAVGLLLQPFVPLAPTATCFVPCLVRSCLRAQLLTCASMPSLSCQVVGLGVHMLCTYVAGSSSRT